MNKSFLYKGLFAGAVIVALVEAFQISGYRSDIKEKNELYSALSGVNAVCTNQLNEANVSGKICPAVQECKQISRAGYKYKIYQNVWYLDMESYECTRSSQDGDTISRSNASVIINGNKRDICIMSGFVSDFRNGNVYRVESLNYPEVDEEYLTDVRANDTVTKAYKRIMKEQAERKLAELRLYQN